MFSPSGRFIVTLADDPTNTDLGRPGTVRVFEVASGRETARIPFPELAHDIRFGADEAFMEIAVGRRRLRWERYPLSPDAMMAKACTFVQRNLEAIEWARFMGDEPRRDTCPAGPLARGTADTGDIFDGDWAIGDCDLIGDRVIGNSICHW